jgi:hypothetical protein
VLERVFEFVSLSYSLLFLHLAAFVPFVSFATFFPLLDDLLELFFYFRSSSCISWSLVFEVQTL